MRKKVPKNWKLMAVELFVLWRSELHVNGRIRHLFDLFSRDYYIA